MTADFKPTLVLYLVLTIQGVVVEAAVLGKLPSNQI